MSHIALISWGMLGGIFCVLYCHLKEPSNLITETIGPGGGNKEKWLPKRFNLDWVYYIMTSMMKYYCILLLYQFGVPCAMSTDPLLLRSRQGLIAHGVRLMEHLRNPWSAAISVSFWWVYLMLSRCGWNFLFYTSSCSSSPPTLCTRLSRWNVSIFYVRANLYTLYKYQNICTHTWIYIIYIYI